MNGLISLLLREGLGAFVGGRILREGIRRLVGLIAFYVVIAILSLATLVFLYVLAYRWLSDDLGEQSAAAILAGGNLLLMGLALLVRSATRHKARPPATGSGNAGFDAGLALGRSLSRELRKAAPLVALAAAVIGLVIGARPEVLEAFRKRPAKARGRRDES